MANKRAGSNGSSGNHDPFRDKVLQSLEALLKSAERNDRRWEEQERRWEEEKRRWEEWHALWAQERLQRNKDREDFARIIEKLEQKIDGNTKITVAALRDVASALHNVNAELRKLRAGRRPGGNGRGNGKP